MSHVAKWTVTLFLFEHEDSVNARAELATEGGIIEGRGHAQLLPGDPNVPEIGDGVAAGRALADLAERLLSVSQTDVQALRAHAQLERKRRADLLPADSGPTRID